MLYHKKKRLLFLRKILHTAVSGAAYSGGLPTAFTYNYSHHVSVGYPPPTTITSPTFGVAIAIPSSAAFFVTR